MTTQALAAQPTQDELIASLDPGREYGDRTHEQVVAEVKAGTLRLTPGYGVPAIWDVSTHRTVKGTGRPLADGLSTRQAAIAAFRALAIDDVPWAYAHLKKGIESGDPRFSKIFWETLHGRDTRDHDGSAAAAKRLFELMSKPAERRTVVLEDGRPFEESAEGWRG